MDAHDWCGTLPAEKILNCGKQRRKARKENAKDANTFALELNRHLSLPETLSQTRDRKSRIVYSQFPKTDSLFYTFLQNVAVL